MKPSYQSKVAQRVTPQRIGWFHKEILHVKGPQPVAVVRKHRVDGQVHAPVILVHGFGQNRYAWHLPERSFVNHLAEHGFDVFNVDLRGHGRSAELGSRRSRGVDDYIRGDLPAVIDAVLARTHAERAFLIGHSLGGICVATAGAREPDKVAGVVTIGPPHALGRGHFVLGNVLRMAGRTVGLTRILRGSRVRLPVDWIGKAVHATRFAWDSELAPLPIRAWKPGSFSRSELRSYIERSFDGASLGTLDDLMELATTGELRSRIDGTSFTKLIEHSTLPLLAISGAADRLANPGSVKPIYERSRSSDKTYVKLDAGHGDLLVGKQAPETTWPLVTASRTRRWRAARTRCPRRADSAPRGSARPSASAQSASRRACSMRVRVSSGRRANARVFVRASRASYISSW
jgi:alpha-beta hydrolase superfamily lysophospholipase